MTLTSQMLQFVSRPSDPLPLPPLVSPSPLILPVPFPHDVNKKSLHASQVTRQSCDTDLRMSIAHFYRSQ